jgi:hypothetical protein
MLTNRYIGGIYLQGAQAGTDYEPLANQEKAADRGGFEVFASFQHIRA